MLKTKICRFVFYFFILVTATGISGAASAQTVNPDASGTIQGKVKDSVYHFIMNSATVAVYRSLDSSLLQFTMPNNFGEFTLGSVPLETPLKLVVTHVGYKPFVKKINIPKASPKIDVGWVYMYQNDSIAAAGDVIVTAMAPVRMNGDTVEFNPDAFKLDSNATAEDLLRVLPGFTVWGDGDITYNGKQISQLLVDGKPFLGGTDMTAATQNLPKGALDKVQVYQQRDEKNPLDSTMFANLKLKEDKKIGKFGKISAGYGSDKHYAMDGMLTGFNKKMQLSAAASVNDVNKIAGNMDMLIRNASYKGVGANTDYQSDFTKSGINKPIAAGMKYQYDFIEDPQYRKQSSLNADYFFNRNNSLNNSNTTENRFLAQDSILGTVSNTRRKDISDNHQLNAAYYLSTDQSTLRVTSTFSLSDSHASTDNTSRQQSNGEDLSLNTASSQNNDHARGLNLTAEYLHSRGWTAGRERIPTIFTLRYSIGLTDDEGNGQTHSSFKSFKDASADTDYDRNYARRDHHDLTQTLYAEYPDLKGLIFGYHNVGGIQIGINNTLDLTSNTALDKVRDFDTVTMQYRENSYLTNSRDLHIVDERPALSFSKSFSKSLTNRYNKYLSINLNLREQYYRFDHKAMQESQNLAYRYQKFLPSFSINYYNHQYGSYEINASAGLLPQIRYPGVDQLAPLVDSTNMLHLSLGNRLLQPASEKNYNAAFSIKSRKSKNPWEIQLNGTYGHIADNFGDSIIYTDAGQTIHYLVNVDKADDYTLGYSYRKALETKNNTYRFLFNYNYSLYKTPGYIKNTYNLSSSTQNAYKVTLDYAHHDKITLKLEEGVSYYQSSQQGFNNSKFKNNNQFTRFTGALQWPKNLVWSSNIAYNRSASDNSAAVNYTIWNAGLTYRFLHGNRGEVKFWAMDLLHQNKGVINKTAANIQTIGFSNTLQQYFMITLSYFPRKFGK